MELELTWARIIKVWWSYTWRNLTVMVAAILVGGIVGGILGAIFGLAGIGTDTARLIILVAGMAIALAMSVIPMKLMLGKDFGEYRLVLLPGKDT